ncbi:MAG: hypothetical protein ACRC2O_15735 [Chitinophagaceae bacterium]|jgi:hypothetical protein
MKATSTQQEVLLITGTRFSSRQCQDKKDAGNPNRLTDNEMLEDACWNGLIQSLMPEVFDAIPDADKLYLWRTKEADSFIELELGEYPDQIEKESSIDPYTFLPFQILS